MSNEVQIIGKLTPETIRLEISAAKIGEIIAERMPEAEFIEAALQLLKNPAFEKCTKESVYGGILKAAIFGFRLSPELGQCWLIPRNVDTGNRTADGKKIFQQVAVFQIGYKGWMELAYRSGAVESFDYGTVYEQDVFDYEQGTTPYLKYRPAKDQKNKGKRIAFFATATLTSGRVVFHVITDEEAEIYRRTSENQYDWIQGQNGSKQKTLSISAKGIWGEHYDAMAVRFPINEICKKKVPKTPILVKAVESDGMVSNLADGKVIDITPKQVEEIAQLPEALHTDYIDELTSCKTKSAIKEVHARQFVNIPEAQKTEYYQLCISLSKNLPE